MALHTGNFNPRAPRGARHYLARGRRILFEFQSTRPSRGATFRFLTTLTRRQVFQSTRPSRGATGEETQDREYYM